MASLTVTIIGGVIVAMIVAYWHIGGSPGDSNSQTPVSHQTSIAPNSLSSSSGDSGESISAPSRPCYLLYPNELNCASSNPEVTLDDSFDVSTYGCTFNYQINWGDGSPIQSINFTGGSAGAFFVANHTYDSKGTFAIHLNDTVTYGQCSTIPADYTFTFG